MDAAETNVVPAELESTWADVLANWKDDQAHRRFITLCSATGRLDHAGRCYRGIGETEPNKKEEAERRISVILGLSAEMLNQLRGPRPAGRPHRGLFVGIGLSLAMMFYALWLLFR